MFTCSPQEKIIVEFIKMTLSKVYTHLILNTVLFSEWSTAVFLCLVIVVHESLVCPEQLNCLLFSRKILRSQKLFGCPAFLCIWTLSNIDCMILRFVFSHRGQVRDSFTTITEDSNTHWCSRRKNHALSARASVHVVFATKALLSISFNRTWQSLRSLEHDNCNFLTLLTLQTLQCVHLPVVTVNLRRAGHVQEKQRGGEQQRCVHLSLSLSVCLSICRSLA